MTEHEPIEASADGKRNAFIHNCDQLMQRRNYAVCLHLCSERKKGRLSITYSDCSTIIGKKTCPALKMRKEEIEAGRSIYFEERLKVVAGFIDMAKDFVGNVVSIASKPKVAKKPKSILDSIDGTGYAQAITNAVKREAEAKAAVVVPIVPVPKVEQVVGESLLDMARRLMGAK